MDDQQRCMQDVREQLMMAERRCSSLQTERDEASGQLDSVEKSRRQLDEEVHESRLMIQELQEQLTTANVSRRKTETEMQAMKVLSFIEGNGRVHSHYQHHTSDLL